MMKSNVHSYLKSLDIELMNYGLYSISRRISNGSTQSLFSGNGHFERNITQFKHSNSADQHRLCSKNSVIQIISINETHIINMHKLDVHLHDMKTGFYPPLKHFCAQMVTTFIKTVMFSQCLTRLGHHYNTLDIHWSRYCDFVFGVITVNKQFFFIFQVYGYTINI